MPITPNVAPVIFEDKEITLEKFLHTRDLFNEVRDKSKSTHFVRRYADSIFVVRFLIDAKKVADKICEIKATENCSSVSSLVSESLYSILPRSLPGELMTWTLNCMKMATYAPFEGVLSWIYAFRITLLRSGFVNTKSCITNSS